MFGLDLEFWDFLFGKRKKRFKNIQPENSNGIFKSSRIMSFAEDSEGTIWIGSFLSGLYSFNPYTGVLCTIKKRHLRAIY